MATSCGVGACAGTAGASTCVDGALIDSCDPLEGAGEEICNGADDNCDGLVDEDGEGGSVCGPLDTEATCPEAVVADTTLEVTPSNPLDASHEGFECLLDDGAWAPCAAGDTFELEHGSHLLHVRAVDGAGHADPTPVVCSFAVDTVPPDTIIELHPADPTRDPVALFGFASDEQPVSYRCALDPAMTPPPADAYTACAATTRFEGLGDGPHVLWVFAVDEAKNADPSPASYGWTVDGSAPETEITSPPVGAVLVGDAVSFEYASPGAPGHSTFQCRLLDQEALWTPCDTGVASWEDLAVGAYTFEVRACHAATGVCDGTPAREDFHVVDALCGVPFELTCEERLTVDAPAEACAWTGVASATATHDCLITVSVDVSSASYPVGVHAIRFAGDDGQGHGDACETALAVRDVTPPSVACGAWEPKLGRVRALGSDACGVSLSVELTACAPAGDPTADAPAETACPVSADGDSLVLDAEPSVAMEVTYTVHAVDPSGLDAQKTCSVTVAPTPGGADPAGSDSGCGSAPGGGSTTPWVLLAMLLVTGSIRRTRVSR